MSEDLQCKENDRKSKIGGHWRVSDGQTHRHLSGGGMPLRCSFLSLPVDGDPS